MVFVYKRLAQFAVRGALPPRRSESPVCATDNKPSCTLHLLGWFIGSRGFSSLERRPEFWVLHIQYHVITYNGKESIKEYTHTHTHTYTVAQMVRIRLQWRRPRFDPWVGKIPWRRAWQPTLVFLPGESSWTEEPGGLQTMGSQRVREDQVTKHSTH